LRRLSEWFGFSLKRKPVKLFVLHFPHRAGIQVCIDERVAALSFFWGDPSEFVPAAHAAGIAVLHQVGSVEAAVRAQQAGVDVIIAQGVEAGGHVAGEVSTMVLLQRYRFNGSSVCLRTSMQPETLS
jgi:NAD(P)H-dependent flavin oxidoreductase YrpB (nitropropane dioxygenase family)